MKKVISVSSILAILLSQAGCVGDNSQKQEEKVSFTYATQEIKQQLAEQLLGEKGPIEDDFFETINYMPIMKQMMEKGSSIFGEKEEQQVFWYYLMRLRMLTMYYTYPRGVDDWGILVEYLDALSAPSREFIEQHPKEGQEIFASVIAYEEKYPYNPQKNIDQQRTKLKNMTRQEVAIRRFGESLEELKQRTEALKNATTREEVAQVTKLPLEKFSELSDEELKQDLQNVIKRHQEELNEYEAFLETLNKQSDEEFNRTMQEEADSLEDVPEQFGEVRAQILQVFKNDLAQMQSGLSPEEYVAQKKAELGIAEYSFYLQAPKLFPAELFFAEFILDPQNDDARYPFRKLFFSNGSVGGTRIEDEKPLPHKADIIWYSITENKTYSLQADLPYEAIKQKFITNANEDYPQFDGLLMTFAPYGQVSLYAYNTISEKKELLGTFQAQETEVSLEDFRQAGTLYENAENMAKDWTDYQQKALVAFPEAATLLAKNGLPKKGFDFWSDKWSPETDVDKDYPLPEEGKLNELDENGETPLINAVRSHKDLLVTKLLTAGADVNVHSTGTGETALTAACAMGHVGHVKQLLAAHADVNTTETQSGMTPLMLAIQSGNMEIVKLLVDAGANVNAPHMMYGKEIGYNALKYALEGNQTEIAQFLREKGAQEPVAPAPTAAAIPAASLDQALMQGDAAQVKALLSQGADPNTLIPGVGPAILFACTTGNVEAVQVLVDAKADVNAMGSISGFTPLMMAAQLGNKALVEILLKAGADVNIAHQVNGQASGLNALKMAQNGGFAEIVDILKSAGAKE